MYTTIPAITIEAMNRNAESYMPPMPRGVVESFRARGHSVTVRVNRHGSLRYLLDAERERTARELFNRHEKLYAETKGTESEHENSTSALRDRGATRGSHSVG